MAKQTAVEAKPINVDEWAQPAVYPGQHVYWYPGGDLSKPTVCVVLHTTPRNLTAFCYASGMTVPACRHRDDPGLTDPQRRSDGVWAHTEYGDRLADFEARIAKLEASQKSF